MKHLGDRYINFSYI